MSPLCVLPSGLTPYVQSVRYILILRNGLFLRTNGAAFVDVCYCKIGRFCIQLNHIYFELVGLSIMFRDYTGSYHILPFEKRRRYI